MWKFLRCSILENLLNLFLKEYYDIIKEFGKGMYGKVVLVKCKEIGINVVLKVFLKSSVKIWDF